MRKRIENLFVHQVQTKFHVNILNGSKVTAVHAWGNSRTVVGVRRPNSVVGLRVKENSAIVVKSRRTVSLQGST